jgi:hypothetical protein
LYEKQKSKVKIIDLNLSNEKLFKTQSHHVTFRNHPDQIILKNNDLIQQNLHSRNVHHYRQISNISEDILLRRNISSEFLLNAKKTLSRINSELDIIKNENEKNLKKMNKIANVKKHNELPIAIDHTKVIDTEDIKNVKTLNPNGKRFKKLGNESKKDKVLRVSEHMAFNIKDNLINKYEIPLLKSEIFKSKEIRTKTHILLERRRADHENIKRLAKTYSNQVSKLFEKNHIL